MNPTTSTVVLTTLKSKTEPYPHWPGKLQPSELSQPSKPGKPIKYMYPIQLVTPMAKDLTEHGFEALTTPADVEQALQQDHGTALLVVNSVCGCAAANARPGAKMSLDYGKRPDKLFTVFAGVDSEAVAKAREYLLPYPPSSPSIALFKDGKLVHMLERRHIEGRSADVIAENLKMAYDSYC
jgi:putative YphP/YqiW family bacilliredoxin